MKAKITLITILWCCLSMVCSVALTGCDNDPHDPDIELSGNISELIPSCAVNLLCTYSISNEYIDLEATPRIYLNLNKWGLKIDKVDYYIDDVLYDTQTVSPYTFTFESHEWKVGAHTLRADITLSGNNIETIIFPCTRIIDNSSSGSKAADIYFDYNYVGTGDELYIEACFNPERSSDDTKIQSFTASWDNISLGEKNTSPYKLTRIINDAAGSKHTLSASVSYLQGNVIGSHSFSFSSYEVCGPTTVRQSYNICSAYRDFKNGEELRGKAILYKGKDVNINYGLEIYLDNNLIAQSKDFPFEHTYLLSDLYIGEHTVTKTWIRYDDAWNILGSISTDETITIME
jgi:lipoprotein